MAKRRTIGALLLGFMVSGIILAPQARAENSSAYTKLDLEADCVTLSTYEAGGSWACAGYKGYPVVLSEGDLRTSVFYGHLGHWFKSDDGQAFTSFGTFNSAGDTIEWRLDEDGLPFAAIQRFHLDDMGDGTRGSVLAVSKVGQPGEAQSCVVAWIDAVKNPDANDRARETADAEVTDFDCDRDEPQWVGMVADLPPSTMNYRPSSDSGN